MSDEIRIRVEREAHKCGADFIVLPASLLRDLFAGMIAAGREACPIGNKEGHGWGYAVASDSYDLADALMAERARWKGE